MFMAFMVVTVSWVYIYPQTHGVVDNNYVQLFTCQSYLHKVVKTFLGKKKKHTFQQQITKETSATQG